VRGTIGGKGDVIVDSATRVNPATEPGYEINQSGSHTLQSKDRDHGETLRTRLIEATVEALADGSAPRLL
jgi:hypothetical protein